MMEAFTSDSPTYPALYGKRLNSILLLLDTEIKKGLNTRKAYSLRLSAPLRQRLKNSRRSPERTRRSRVNIIARRRHLAVESREDGRYRGIHTLTRTPRPTVSAVTAITVYSNGPAGGDPRGAQLVSAQCGDHRYIYEAVLRLALSLSCRFISTLAAAWSDAAVKQLNEVPLSFTCLFLRSRRCDRREEMA